MRKAVIIFLVKDHEVLLLHARYPDGNVFWQGVSGYVEPNEDSKLAAIREAHEELAVTLNADDIKQIHTFTVNDTEFTVYRVDTWQDELGIQEGGIEELHWFPIDKLPLDQMHPTDKDWLPGVLSR